MCLVSLVVMGLLLQGQAGTLRRLLGVVHWHAPQAAQVLPGAHTGGWLQTVQAWRQQVQARSPWVAGHTGVEDHHHDGMARHHHGPADDTVVALEPLHGSDASTSDAGSGSLLHPLAPASGMRWHLPAAMAAHWARTALPGWRDASVRRPERPPRA